MKDELLRPAPPDGRTLAETLARELSRGTQAPVAERELRRLADRLDGALQIAGDGVVVADAQGRIVWANAAAVALHGHLSGDQLARSWAHEIDSRVEVLDEWGQLASAARLPLLAVRSPEAPEVPLRFRDRRAREERFVVVRTSALRDDEGRPFALLAVYRDATEQRRAEESLRILARAGALLAGPHDLSSALDTLSRLAIPALADGAVVELVPHDAALRWPARVHLRAEAPPRELEAVDVFPTARPEIVEPLPQRLAPRYSPLSEQGCSSALQVPLVWQGVSFGTLILGGRPVRRRFGAAELALAEDLAARVAAALETARKLDESRLVRAEETRRAEAVELGLSVAQALHREQRRSNALGFCAEAVRRRSAARVARIWTCGEAGQLLELQATSCEPSSAPPPPLEAFEVRRIALHGMPRVVPDVLIDPLLASCGAGSFVGLPLRSGDVEGVLALFFAGPPAADLDALLAPTLEALGCGLRRARELEEAQAARAHAVEDARRKEEFVAVLAHELRNPLAPIVTALGLMRTREGDGKTIARERALVERQVAQLSRLVDDLLDVSRAAQGKLELRREPVDLSSVVSRAIEASQPLIARFRHTLQVTLPDEGVFLVADPVRLSQVISNLLNNAAKYTPPGGRIRLTVERVGDEAVLRVRDTGIGIPPDLLSKLFVPFVQGSARPEHARGGLGIGLSLVKALVDLHGGEVTVASGGPNSGSEFAVRLPALPDTQLAIPLPPPPHEAALVAAAQGRRVLVVDDNRDAADMLAEALRIWGCDVRVATDGAAALEAASERKPDVILLDIGMPGMDGHEVARRLRKDKALRDVHLVAVTGYGREMDLRQSKEAGFDLHLTKPVELDVLQKAIANAPRVTASEPPRPSEQPREAPRLA